MTLRQYKLKSGDRELICWLEDGRAKVGDAVTLKDNENHDEWWEVVEAYSTTDHLNRGWDNNI